MDLPRSGCVGRHALWACMSRTPPPPNGPGFACASCLLAPAPLPRSARSPRCAHAVPPPCLVWHTRGVSDGTRPALQLPHSPIHPVS